MLSREKLIEVIVASGLKPEDIWPNHGMPGVSGRECRGTTFETPYMHVDNAVHNSETPGVFACGPAYYRRCGWDNTITPQVLQGGPCPHCDRNVNDVNVGCLPKECIVPVKAVQVYIDQVKLWFLIQVPHFESNHPDAG